MKTTTFEVSPIWVKALGTDDVQDFILEKTLSYKAANYWHDRRYQSGKWDGINRIYNKKSKVFPIGLLERAANGLEKEGYQVQIIDKRKTPEVDLPESIHLHGIELRDSQLDAIEQALDAGSGIIKASTGFGKTEVMAGIIYALALPTIILVHKKDLLYQTAERLALRLQTKVGVIGDGVYDPDFVTVCTFQTARSLLRGKISQKEFSEVLKGFSVMMIDEAHHATAPSYRLITRKIPAYFRYGFSATPFKDPVGSEMELIGLTGEMLIDFSPSEAISKGISVKPYCYMMQRPQLKFFDDVDYQTLVQFALIENKHRNNIIQDVCKNAQNAKLPGLIIVERLDHGNILERLTGWPFISGEHDAQRRQKTMREVNEGKIPGLISTVMDEGVDVPNIAFIVLASGGKAKHRLIQRVGRGIRKGIYDFCIVVDFEDKENETLETHTRQRKKAYKSQGFELNVVDKLPDLKEFINAI